MKYRKRPVVIEAMQLTTDFSRYDEICDWAGIGFPANSNDDGNGIKELFIDTLEGRMKAVPGDWIIRGVSGEFYPCKPDIFTATYETLEGAMSDQNKTALAWHFTADKFRDGRPIPKVGEVLRHEGEIAIGKLGLHASERIIDALTYAPGHIIHRVECRDITERLDDKFVCRERVRLWSVNGEALLREFARWCALRVIHLWDAPDVVRRHLETGDESIRDAASYASAAWDASAAWAAAWDAAWAAQNTKLTELVEAAREQSDD